MNNLEYLMRLCGAEGRKNKRGIIFHLGIWGYQNCLGCWGGRHRAKNFYRSFIHSFHHHPFFVRWASGTWLLFSSSSFRLQHVAFSPMINIAMFGVLGWRWFNLSCLYYGTNDFPEPIFLGWLWSAVWLCSQQYFYLIKYALRQDNLFNEINFDSSFFTPKFFITIFGLHSIANAIHP